MSRIGKSPIAVPQGVEVKIDGTNVTVKGPKGTLTKEFQKVVNITMEENKILVSVSDEKYGNIHGLTRTLINNMVVGVSKGFEKTLEINGVGYRASKQGKKLVLNVGYSHPVEFSDSEDVTIEVPNPNTIVVKGIDKQMVGQMAAEIREIKLSEPYKGKVIKYAGEKIARKEGKAGGKK
jgi:large subunit ribosomal protein L6